jgi:ATP dependent DNA ligase domain
MRVTRDLRRRLWCAELCLPRLALRLPAGPGWIHEIKHDGFRILAKQNAAGAHLFTRKGYDLAVRFPLATTAVAALPARSCLIDGEAIACDQSGVVVFEMIRWRRHDQDVVLCAFDLLELDGQDLRRSRSASEHWKSCCTDRRPVSLSMNTMMATVRPFSGMLVGSAVKELCRNGLVHPTAQAA